MNMYVMMTFKNDLMETEQEKYQRALTHVKQVKRFYGKIINAIIVCAVVAAVNYYVNEFRNPWVLWVVGFSAFGIIIEAGKLYGMTLFLGKGWERRKIQEHLEKEEEESRSNPIIRK